jgi:hypothetical protein
MSNGFKSSLSRVGARFLLVSCCTGALSLACGSSPSGGETWPKGNVVFADTNNYTSVTSLTIPVVTAAPGADLDVCWDALMKDLLCHNIEGTNDIDNVAFLKIPNMDKTKVSNALAIGQLDENLVAKYGDYHTDQGTASCAKLSTFKLGGTLIAPATDFVAPTGSMNITYMLLFATGTTPGVGSKSMLFLDPTGTATSVNAMDACSNNVLQFTATLGAPMPISATDSSKWHVDWSQLTHDSFDNDVLFTKISSVLIGFYQGKTAAQLEADFKNIEQNATTLWEVPVAPGARDVKLGDAKVRGGTTPFPGFTQTDGVYALAVLCAKCQVPAPVMLTILQPQ